MTTASAQYLTLAFLVAITSLVIAYDVLALRAWGPDATISRVMAATCRRWPILYPVLWFAIGVFCGHVGLPAE